MTKAMARLGAAMALTVAARGVAAQDSQFMAACYVPASGTVYRIDTPASPAPGAPKQCVAPSHTRFRWVALPTLAGGALDLSADGGFAAIGAGGTSSTLGVAGPGTRLLWYPRQAAFRAGRVTGTQWDEASLGLHSTALGFSTLASNFAAFAAGSVASATGFVATAFGNGTTASGTSSFAAGSSTTASGDAAIAMGSSSQATAAGAVALGTTSFAGAPSAIAAGRNARAQGDHAVALGENVLAAAGGVALGTNANAGPGSFAFVDASSPVPFGGGENSFRVRAVGGASFTSSLTGNGVVLAPGSGSWQSLSDVRRKTAFREVDGERLLGKLAAMPVRTWQYRAQVAAIRHIGPTAQDFRRAFEVGESDTTITSVDADGVALAAARALERRTAALRRENAALRAAADTLRRRLAAVERTLASVTAIHDIAGPASAAPATPARRAARAARAARAN